MDKARKTVDIINSFFLANLSAQNPANGRAKRVVTAKAPAINPASVTFPPSHMIYFARIGVIMLKAIDVSVFKLNINM
ncbi:MAG TPA: hypothetical protein VHP38_10340 [Ruminiclostridium sp.]|nr:hypothetical protein [Ruminiclostridium sp.]